MSMASAANSSSPANMSETSPANRVLKASTARLWNAATGKTRSEGQRSRRAWRGARERAFARLSELLSANARHVDRRRISRRGRRPARRSRTQARDDDRRRISGDRGSTGAARPRAANPLPPIRRLVMPPMRCRCCAAAGPSRARSPRSISYLVTVCDHGMNASTFCDAGWSPRRRPICSPPSPPAIAR